MSAMMILFILYIACKARSAFAPIGVADQAKHALGGDLPKNAEFVLQPAARTLRASIRGERFPVVVRLRLILGLDEERDGFVEFVARATLDSSAKD